MEPYSGLHLASLHGVHGIVQLLLKTDPKVVYYRNKDGRSPNHSVAEGGHVEVCKELVERFHDIDNAKGKNALQIAIRNNNLHLGQYILETTKSNDLLE